LDKHSIFGGDKKLIDEIVKKATIEQYASNSVLIQQDGEDSDIFFVISGKVLIEVNGRVINKRVAGQHVGEMALIDSTARRSATVRASELTVVARLSESKFSQIANQFPILWRRLALELGDRLRQRNRLVPDRRLKPHIFIGSSTEALTVAKELKKGLIGNGLTTQLWTDGIFTASKTTIEALELALTNSDFAILVLAPDDTVTSRGKTTDAPRDNVIFELGLFMGALSRGRTFLVTPRKFEIKLPTDLLGITRLTYLRKSREQRVASIKFICREIKKLVFSNGPK
jgi:predicted nucleotide-binding protein